MLYLARDALKLQLFLTPQIHARCVEDVIQIMQAVLTTLSANITSYPGSTTRIHGGAQAQKV